MVNPEDVTEEMPARPGMDEPTPSGEKQTEPGSPSEPRRGHDRPAPEYPSEGVAPHAPSDPVTGRDSHAPSDGASDEESIGS